MNYYSPPTWMNPPKENTWRLDEIKSGVIVNSYALNVPLVIFGRTPPSCPSLPPAATRVDHCPQADNDAFLFLAIVTAHESCSRIHARIAFDSKGVPWLRDLGSGNGTKGKMTRMVIIH